MMFRLVNIAIFIFCFGMLSLPNFSYADQVKPTAYKKHQTKSKVKFSSKKYGRNGHVARASSRAHVVRTSYKRPMRTTYRPPVSYGDLAGLNHSYDPLSLASSAVLVMDQSNSEIMFDKNSQVALPMASITKMMTGMVVLDAHLNLDEILEVTDEDIDLLKHSSSRLSPGSLLSRRDMLHIALMSSENRAASALGRNYPGGKSAFIHAMNEKARSLGMSETRYVDSTGLSSHNVASARDLAKLVVAAYRYPLLREFSTDSNYTVHIGHGRQLQYRSSNRLIGSTSWDIGLQKTGYIAEAGHCLVMQAYVDGRPVVMVFMDSKGKYSRLADANRVKKWLDSGLKERTL